MEAQESFESNPRTKRSYEKAKEDARRVDSKSKLAVHRVKVADDEAYSARMDAEQTFEDAESKMSAEMARLGAQKAIGSWDLRQKSIRKAQALAHRK